MTGTDTVVVGTGIPGPSARPLTASGLDVIMSSRSAGSCTETSAPPGLTSMGDRASTSPHP
jgi:hypothetical protein